MIYSRPVTYVTYDFEATDGREHPVAIHFDAGGEIAVNEPGQKVVGSVNRMGALTSVCVGSKEQAVLGQSGDDRRIDWGYFYLAAKAAAAEAKLISSYQLRDQFVAPRNQKADRRIQSGVPADSMLATLEFAEFKVSSRPVTRMLMLAYDDEFSLQYFKKNLRPYWRHNGDDAAALLKRSDAEYESLNRRCEGFDAELMADLRKCGGEKYARLCALAYRQITAATKVVVDDNGQPLAFTKENSSDGSISTVDVLYPMAPYCLLLSPSLTKALLVPPLDYAGSPRWKFPFAPCQLGTWPLANGQTYGGGETSQENQMPVEESANLIILVTALAESEGHADFAAHYWPLLAKWADYLKAKGFDPEKQLCTDDFMGPLAHNANLSAKAIVALGAYGKLCAMHGETEKAKEFTALAKEFAARWVKEDDDGDHFRLAFDQPGTWSQKYNLIWDRVLGLNLFVEGVLRKEMAYYPKVMSRYGLPLDNRKAQAELPWSFWTASLTGDDGDYHKVFDPIYNYVNTTPSRLPFADLYQTETANAAGFRARPVLGGIFIRALLDHTVWQKWASRDTGKPADWAPMPTPP
jgi:hypothetical protein